MYLAVKLTYIYLSELKIVIPRVCALIIISKECLYITNPKRCFFPGLLSNVEIKMLYILI